MRRIMKRAASLVLATALIVTGIYCGGTDAQAAKKVKKITMNKKKVTVTVGGKFTLKVKKVTPAKASKAVTYKSKNSKIAKVTKKGVITGKKKGSTTITVTSKKNKKVKATVKVTVKNKSAATPTPVANPVATATATAAATAAPTNGPTGQPTVAPTPVKTQRPTGTPRPTASPTPDPTRPPELDGKKPSAPYTLAFNENTIVVQGGEEDAGYVINNDGSVTIHVNKLYCGVAFVIPADLKENNFDTVTVTYKDVTNVGGGYGCGLWRTGDNKDTEDVMSYGGVFAEKDENDNPITSGEYVATIAGRTDGTNAWYVNKILLFHNDEEAHKLTPSAQVTITKIVFSHSEYKGGSEQPTTPPENTSDPNETPGPDFAAKKISTDITIDGIADDAAWADVPELLINHRVVCDNKGDSTTTATAKLAWDENNLYGLVKVIDDNIDATATGGDHLRDGIEFLLDEDNSRETAQGGDGGNYSQNKDAFHYRFTGLKQTDGTKDDPMTDRIVSGSNDATEFHKDDKKIQTAYEFTEDGYIVEFKIPFQVAKQAGDVVGFDIIVQDCKNGNRDAEIYLRNTETALNYWNLNDAFGTLVLEETAEDPGPDTPEALEVDLSTVAKNSSGVYNAETGKLTINDESTSAITWVKSPVKVEPGKSVSVNVKGSYTGNSGFRIWLGDGNNSNSNVQIYAVDAFQDTNGVFDETITFTVGEDKAASEYFTFKGIASWNDPPGTGQLLGITIDSMTVTPIED